MTRLRAKRRALVGGGLAMTCAAIFAVCAVCLPGTPVWLVLAVGALSVFVWLTHRPNDGVPAIMYHSVSASADWLPWSGNISVTPEAFEVQLMMLKRAGFSFVASHEYVRARANGEPLPERAVMLHFDDGYLDNWVAAYPLLRKHQAVGSVFISLDFIGPGSELRSQLHPNGDANGEGLTWDGYLNWTEIAELDRSGVMHIEAHGVDHGRVVISDRSIGHLTADGWKRHAWMEWAGAPSAKFDWYLTDTPRYVELGAPVMESLSALAAPGRDAVGADAAHAQLEGRISKTAQACQEAFTSKLGRPARIFCWPFNQWAPGGHEQMLEQGFEATTCGTGHNASHDDPTRIGRIHAPRNAFGVSSPALDSLYLYASVQSFRGRYYWSFLTAFADVARRVL